MSVKSWKACELDVKYQTATSEAPSIYAISIKCTQVHRIPKLLDHHLEHVAQMFVHGPSLRTGKKI